jgi:hypothetical protein
MQSLRKEMGNHLTELQQKKKVNSKIKTGEYTNMKHFNTGFFIHIK